MINDRYLLRKDIQNIDSLQLDCETTQHEISDRYFEQSLLNLTHINHEMPDLALKSFIHFNNKLTNFYTNTYVQKKLIEFLLNRSPDRLLILDQYHFNVLVSFEPIIGNIQSYFPLFKLVDDQLSSIVLFKDHSDVLLYNISIYQCSDYTKYIYQHLKNIHFFYQKNDKIAPTFSCNELNTSETTIDVLKDSYEHNRHQSIDEFFNTLSLT